MSLHGARRSRVVAVTSYLPSPLDRGDPVRVDMYLRALNDLSDLTVLATEREDSTERDIEDLARRLPGAVIHTFRPSSARAARQLAVARWIHALISRTPSWIANRSSPEINNFLKVNGSSFDYCFLLGEAAGQYASQRANGIVHWDKSNVLTASTRGDVDEAPRWSASRARLRLISGISRRFEGRVLSQVDQVSVTSKSEASRLQRLLNREADFVHPSTIQAPSGPLNIQPDSKTILWMGSFQYHSNVNGLRRFLDSGLPVLRSRGYTLRLVGSGASSDFARQMQSIPGVDYHGFVPDLTDAATDVKAAVIPLWSGAGVKIKTLTLMGLGVPVVGTQTAFEGISLTGALGLSESPEEMARLCVDANSSDLRAAQTRALDELEHTFSEDGFFKRVSAQIARP